VLQTRDNDISQFLNKAECDFKFLFRVSKNVFLDVVNKIENHEVFNHSGHKTQRSVDFQLLVCLRRLGLHGNGNSYSSLQHFFHISIGAIDTYCDRCLSALHTLRNEVIKWPVSTEKKKISDAIEKKTKLPGCIGFIDGTHIEFEFKPSTYGEDYYNYKCAYSLTLSCVEPCNLQGFSFFAKRR
jgi:hypothetical protein